MCVHHIAEIMRFVHSTTVMSTPEQIEDDAARKKLADEEEAAREAGVVYYVRVGELVKIGTTRRRIQTRMGTLPPDRQLLATEPGGPILERARHLQFQHLRFNGEWFIPAPELWRHITAVRGEHGEPPTIKIRDAS